MNGLPEVASRYKLASYWWLASELVRRNPKLELRETYPMDGFYDCLSLFGDGSRGPVHIDFNRLGSVHVHPDHIHFMEISELVSRENPHDAIKRIEGVAGLTPAIKAPTSSARVVTLRVMAALMNFLVNDRARWDLRMLAPDASGYAIPVLESLFADDEQSPLPVVFPNPADFRAFLMGSRFAEPFVPGRFWALKRDDDVVAVFDTQGLVHTEHARITLKPLYARTGRNITQTMATALADILP
ncbi:TY-Chap2 family putative peptide chaperone [Leifsonia sp. 2MCAF36]|uniref:TY-Chap2 family putative peptide chaperone n=1 Tax=Leifsonia sp. 2MCAF36 TaxID=3232988 RepID=UPI003F9B4EB2